MSDSESTMEIKFRLDQEGRTAKQTECKDNGDQPCCGEPPTSTIPPTTTNSMMDRKMDYDTNVAFISRLSKKSPSSPDLLDDLLLDCEIADCGIMPRTFWISANAEPRFRLEQLALAVFRHHVKSVDFDIETSGAEWWVQLRPSPEKTGRYAMLEQSDNIRAADSNSGHPSNNNDGDDDLGKNGISFHWDKDEELRLLTDGAVHLHPHLSTVTYLTDLGCPTLVLNFSVDNFTGTWMAPTKPEGVVAWPKQGKHLSFDGRFLHAAPPDLMEDGVFAKQCQLEDDDVATETDEKKKRRRRRRVTFLVNIWLNYRPVQVDPFPETMIDKMSRDASNVEDWAFDRSGNEDDRFINIDHNDGTTTRMTWPMGDCSSNETIEADTPLQAIHDAGKRGANVRMEWKTGTCQVEGTPALVHRPGIGLYRGKTSADEHTTLVASATAVATGSNGDEELQSTNAHAKRKR